jgi:hypothetical protein
MDLTEALMHIPTLGSRRAHKNELRMVFLILPARLLWKRRLVPGPQVQV